MKKRAIGLIALTIIVAASLFAGGAGDKTASGVKTIRMWTFLDPTKTDGRSVALKTIIDNFEAANPGVKVEVEPQNWNTMTAKFLAAAASKTAPDICWCLQDEMGGVLDANALEPFENLFLIGAWNEFIAAAVMIDKPSLRSIQLSIYYYQGFYGREWGPLTAAAVVAIVPILIVFSFLGKLMVSGMTAGAVKE